MEGVLTGNMEQHTSLPEELTQPLRIRRYRTNTKDKTTQYHIFYADGRKELIEATTAYEACKKAAESGEIVRVVRESTSSKSLVDSNILGQGDEFIEIGFAELFSGAGKGKEEGEKRNIDVIPAPDTASVDFLTDEVESLPHRVSLSDIDDGDETIGDIEMLPDGQVVVDNDGQDTDTAAETMMAVAEEQVEGVAMAADSTEEIPPEPAGEDMAAAESASESPAAEDGLSAEEVEALLNASEEDADG